MHPARMICFALAVLVAAWLVAACGSEPRVERVDVTWASLEPPPRWGLFPGYRQEIGFKKRSAYRVDIFVAGRVLTGGTVGDTGSALAFVPSVGARDIEAQASGATGMDIYVTLRDDTGQSRRVHCLKIERSDDKIWFEFVK